VAGDGALGMEWINCVVEKRRGSGKTFIWLPGDGGVAYGCLRKKEMVLRKIDLYFDFVAAE